MGVRGSIEPPGRPRAPLSRLGAFGAVAGLAVLGPVLESALGGGGRGWAVGFLVLVLAPSFLRAGGVRFHPLDPETFVPVMYFLSAGYAPCLHLLSSHYWSLNQVEIAALQVAYMGAVACALFCTIFSRAPGPPAEGAMLPARILARDWAVIATGLSGAVLVVTFIGMTGVRRLLSSSYADTYVLEEGKGVLLSGWYFIQLAIAHCAARIVDFRRVGEKVPRVLVVAICLMLAAFLMNTLLGRRGPLIWATMSVALCAHLSGVRIRRLWMAGAVAVTLVYAFAIEGYRTQLDEGAEERFEAARAGLERVENPFVIQELEGVFANLAIVVEQQPPILYYPGESWVNAFLVLIPKPIYPDRPTALSQRYVMWAAPSFAREGGGFAFNATGEGFINLGMPGAVIEVFLFAGLFFFLPLALCIGRQREPLARSLAACLASYAYNQFRGEFASMLKIAVTFLLAAAFMLVATALIQQFLEQFSQREPGGSAGRLRAPR